MKRFRLSQVNSTWAIVGFLVLTAMVYWPGLQGGFLFDDYPNIVDNKAVQPAHVSLPSMIAAAMSSPSSELKRPLASLSFAVNYAFSGLDPFWMKLTNLVIHLLNGVLLYFFIRALQQHGDRPRRRTTVIAVLVSGAWLLLPINLTAVLYTVQRMESLANLFVLVGLIGYLQGRKRMLAGQAGFGLAIASLCFGFLGVFAKETAIMLPLYAACVEYFLIQTATIQTAAPAPAPAPARDRRVISLFFVILVIPLIVGLVWLVPILLRPAAWATRDFTLSTRLLTESRVILDYLIWTVLPGSHSLPFYYDNFQISSGITEPWTTLPSTLGILTLVVFPFFVRRRAPMIATGISLYIACHLLTGTIIPLELVYEHRNYFASIGVLIAFSELCSLLYFGTHAIKPMRLAATVLAVCLLGYWTISTALSAQAWSSNLLLARELAYRAPNSPRAEYELGRTYIILSGYRPSSPFTSLAYEPLERSARLRDSSILPEQALIFFNARMRVPIDDRWWESLIEKLRNKPASVQDESALDALVQCHIDRRCDLSAEKLSLAFSAARSHSNATPRLQAIYTNFLLNVSRDTLGARGAISLATHGAPREPAYWITSARIDIALGREAAAKEDLATLEALNVGGMLDENIEGVRQEILSGFARSKEHQERKL